MVGKIVEHDFNNDNVFDFKYLTKEEILRKIALILEESEYSGKPVRIRVENFNMLYNKNIVEIMSFNE